ncbi:MAG TPA: flavodoxin family protein [Candidatus Bathyarchaeia archaeon]|nr:flavodoxin family protein [Candidatus Bathyarchaeia archaeon]
MQTEKIKILGISASPRAVKEKSHSDTLLSGLLDWVAGFGGEAKKILLAEKDIAQCEGCYSKGPRTCVYPCVHEDDTNAVLAEIEKADAIAFSTPVYWGSASSLLHCLIEKMTALENNRWEITNQTGRDPLEGKPFVILASQLMEGAMLMMSQISAALIQMGMFPLPYGFIFQHSLLEKRGVRLGLRLIGEKRFAYTGIDIRLAARNLVGIAKLLKNANYRFDDDALREHEW